MIKKWLDINFQLELPKISSKNLNLNSVADKRFIIEQI
jgi:hypothetical protein